MCGGLAFGQANLPPCDPNNTTNCTDYFGVANWANSPLPAGAITGFTVKAAGSGYSSPTTLVFTLTDVNLATPLAITPTVTLTTDGTGGLATVTGTVTGSFIAPQITVTDMGLNWPGVGSPATCGGAGQPACGSGAVVLATIGAPLIAGTGIRKFLATDTLTLPAANLTLAVADTTTFPGADYYVIGLQEYTAKMHTDLPPTKLRGYCQMNTLAAPGVCTLSYLGPTIIATKNRPVRVLFKNMLPTGSGGNLFIPTDTTYMGAGPPYTQNRATLHLHGGATPWISDGTPHQWTTPARETGPARGDSVQFVPDMWFDSTNGALITSCAAQPTCTAANATNDPGQGSLTFFWTNQQGGRLMFYHDHAYGITRFNVYAGEAAGYLLADPAEEASLAAATVPGTISDLAHLVPLVIQDKTFVPTPGEVAFEDPTWLKGFGTTPGGANPGDLWFPHVYTTNQNPADPGGANAFGRWDYGPWTLPGNQTLLLAANPEETVQTPCTSTAFPNQAVNCPITPNPSGTPEGFMDTPLVNGKAYPVLHVAPEAYRFQMLMAGNDRSWNLSWYVADPTVTTPDLRTNTEVKMVPAIQPSGAAGTTPLCTQITPITNTTLFMGLATGLLDSSGNPINGTGLPAGCWPNFGAGSQAAGIPVQQTMWGADGRAGGVPDPTTAGPPFIEIGTEGGLLPAPVVIPAMPIGYEANTRSVTITNVSVHGLWLGPAERADTIVDFSKFVGKTLILYNDAPTPAPAIDSRTDYFTGDGDQTPIGGAPNTLAGFGPNTRTIMQVVVDQPLTGAPPFQLAKLQATLPGIFAQTQPQIIVPEPTHPPASGGYSPVLTYSLITDATLTYFPVGSTTPVTITDERKAIQELFTLDYGRMNATLGTELPLTNFLTQTTIPLGYIDPPTETIKQGDTQLWHITHNGVDTHFIHFHLFNVQVINRSGWDGTVRPPDQNELGWKDTVRMNPLEDILVALQPITPVLPFPVRDSFRLMDVTNPANSNCPAPAAGPSPLPCSIFTDVDPFTNIGTQTPNKVVDFGWEYVWHCHILGHEENDMMRPMVFQVPPEAPTNLAVAPAAGGPGLTLTWTDNSASEHGFTLQRDTTAAFSAPTPITVGASTPDANGQGTGWGGTISYTDPTAAGTGLYFYRVQAFKPDAAYWSPGPPITSAWSNVVSFGAISSVSPLALAFGTVTLNTPSTPQTTVLSNSSVTATFTYTVAITGTNAADFAVASNTCAGAVATAAICPIGVTFTPTLTVLESANLVITTTAPGNPTYTVSLTGTGQGLPSLTITANNTTMKYGSKALPILTFSYNPPNPAGTLTPPTCTTTAIAATTGGSPVGTYPITCSGAVDTSYTITYVPGSLTITPVPLTIWASNASMAFMGTVPAITPLPVGFVNGDTLASLTTQPTCTTTATSTSNVGTYPSSCSGAVDANYTISYVKGTVTIAKGVLTITAPSPTMPYGGPLPALTPIFSPANPSGLTTQPVCTTTATTSSPVGTYPVTCSGAASAPGDWSFSYVAGTLTVSPTPLTITASGTAVAYGAPVPAIAPSYSGFVLGQGPGNLTGTVTCSTTYTSTSPVSGNPYSSSCSGATSTNYAITYVPGVVTITRATTTTTINSNPNPSTLKQPVTVAFTVAPKFTGTPTGNVTVAASTGETCTGTAPSGSCTITFLSAGTRTLTAVYAGDTNFLTSTSGSVSQIVNAPTVSPNPTSWNFGNWKAGTTSAPPKAFTITNTGLGALINFAWSITGNNPSNFSIASTTCTATLLPGANCVINLTFTPTVKGTSYAANLTLTDNALNSPQNIALSGKGN
jgi:FtsP/CotA-like multicopper oxidase with cupredoxin domain